jgi:hypothetical protein
MHWLSPIFYMEAILRHLKKRIKTIGINWHESSQKSSLVHPFDHKRNDKILEEAKVEPADEQLRRYIKLATACNKEWKNRIKK